MTADAAAPPRAYRRHALPVRIAHWINVLALTVLIGSGLNIFDAYPELHWGAQSYSGAPPVLAIGADTRADGQLYGYARVFGREFETTGWLGLARGPDGELEPRAFPSWMTIPDFRWLAMARSWHLTFAWLFVLNGLAYLAYSLVSRHLRRDLLPTADDLRSFGASVRDHLRFRHASGEAARRYNVLQKLAYVVVILVVLPLVLVTGLGMSPWANAIGPDWVDVLGGRQSARTIHFVCAWILVAFTLVHVFQVVVTGFWNNVRSMITGRYVVPEARHE
jgi:thiosulfate reductase cytochrome b subunit